MFQCTRDGEIRSFGSFAECRRFALREGDHNRLWCFIGIAQLAYEASLT